MLLRTFKKVPKYLKLLIKYRELIKVTQRLLFSETECLRETKIKIILQNSRRLIATEK